MSRSFNCSCTDARNHIATRIYVCGCVQARCHRQPHVRSACTCKQSTRKCTLTRTNISTLSACTASLTPAVLSIVQNTHHTYELHTCLLLRSFMGMPYLADSITLLHTDKSNFQQHARTRICCLSTKLGVDCGQRYARRQIDIKTSQHQGRCRGRHRHRHRHRT